MNYRHIEHAGNFADVFKHSILTLLLRELRKQEAPFCYIETHAGAGLYDLCSDTAQTKGEHRRGIARLCENASVPEALDYLAVVRAVNAGSERANGRAVRRYVITRDRRGLAGPGITPFTPQSPEKAHTLYGISDKR